MEKNNEIKSFEETLKPNKNREQLVPLETTGQYGWIVGMFLFAQILTVFVYSAIGGFIDQTPALVLSQCIAYVILIPVSFMLIRNDSKRDFDNLKETIVGNWWKLIVGFILALFITMGITNTLQAILEALGNTIPETSENQEGIEEVLDAGGLGTVSMILLTIVLAPVFEELVFRLGLIRIFEKADLKWVGYIASSLLFALIHVSGSGDWLAITPYISSGIVFTGIYVYFKGNIFYPIMIHMMWNIMVTVIIFTI